MHNKEKQMDETMLFHPHGSKEHKELEALYKKKPGKVESETLIFHPYGSKEHKELESSTKKKKETMSKSY